MKNFVRRDKDGVFEKSIIAIMESEDLATISIGLAY